MRFPAEEDKIPALGREVSRLEANKDLFPNPPIEPEKLDLLEQACIDATEAAVAAHTAAERATAIKHAAFITYADNIKTELRYAENTVDFDDIKLKTLGWGGRKGRTPLAPPGRALDLAIVEIGRGRISLRWARPDGGKVATYKILRRDRAADGDWRNEGVALATEITLAGQEQGKELEYGVVSMIQGRGRPHQQYGDGGYIV
uniref:Fibronectin type III domain-containing protein n=1 Tax=Candidatus Kentrum sp. LPFa TaxID=2126335 RepID=A0A450Y421_9GAMM|nr:MAG: hypothetical protein BECKLPF1236A_GA0070988_104642 [Candidatus Kentron sp. LPFa]VFK36202.1 MAG: hypothetical protein BECKLPF1236C_GA0070990_105201 [Candidatus Kentron sp. LPFa]